MGRPEFEMVIASAPREEIYTSELYPTTWLDANTIEETLMYSPNNTITKVFAMYALCRTMVSPQPTTGTHKLGVGYSSPTVDVLYAESDRLTDILITQGCIVKGNVSAVPDNQTGQQIALTNITFDSHIPLAFRYSHTFDVKQTEGREYRIIGVTRELADL